MKLRFETAFRGLILVWVFICLWSLWASAQTNTNKPPAPPTNTPPGWVEHLEKHYLTFGFDRVGFLRETTFFGEPFWKYLASLVYIVLAFLLAHFIDFFCRSGLKRLALRTETRLDDLLFELLRGPIKVVAFVILIHIGLNIFQWSPKAEVYFSRALIIVVAGSLTYLTLKVIGVLLDNWQRRGAHEADRKFNEQLFSVMRKSINVFIIVVAVLVTAQNMGVNITAAITSLSIGGLAVGLAAQDTLANLFGAVAIFVDKPFRVGDQIKLDAAEGQVEAVGLRSTRIRNAEGHLVAVPNKIMGNAAITNITQRPSIKTVMNLALARTLPGDKVKRALAILHEIYRKHPMTQDVWISFNQFAAGNINIQIVHWWKGTDYQKYLAGMEEMNLAVKDRFDAEGISFA